MIYLRNILHSTDTLFSNGLKLFNSREFYKAHDVWEELWSDYKLPDSLFVQALIQLAVGFYHMECRNLNGARGLFKKTIPKLAKFVPEQRGLDIASVLYMTEKNYKYLRSIDVIKDINDELYFRIDDAK